MSKEHTWEFSVEVTEVKRVYLTKSGATLEEAKAKIDWEAIDVASRLDLFDYNTDKTNNFEVVGWDKQD